VSERDPLRVALAEAERYLAGLPERPVATEPDVEALRALLAIELPARGEPAGAVIETLAEGVDAAITATGSPRFFAWVVGGTLPVAMAADWLTSAWDSPSGASASGASLALVEETAGAWLLDLLGLPASASFGFTTGCQTAHVVALAAARHELLARRGVDVEQSGLAGAPAIRVVGARERHVTVDFALRYLGIGMDAFVALDVDDQGRADPADVARTLAAEPDAPTIVVCQAGNINTGAFEDFAALAAAAHEHGAWLHVDGAFGLWAGAEPSRRHLVAGVELADSWATDNHKVLNVPYESGFVASAHPAAHHAAMSGSGSYLAMSDTQRDTNQWVLEFSRRARAIPTYAALRALGRDGVAALVAGLCERALEFADQLSRLDGASVLNEVVFNQVLVGFDGGRADAVIAAVQRSGEAFLTGAQWQGETVMRVSVCNHATTGDDVRRTVAAIAAAVR
jgi:glutamate/tyrosine decarboxylase-like PLP-dependent enzyme